MQKPPDPSPNQSKVSKYLLLGGAILIAGTLVVGGGYLVYKSLSKDTQDTQEQTTVKDEITAEDIARQADEFVTTLFGDVITPDQPARNPFEIDGVTVIELTGTTTQNNNMLIEELSVTSAEFNIPTTGGAIINVVTKTGSGGSLQYIPMPSCEPGEECQLGGTAYFDLFFDATFPDGTALENVRQQYLGDFTVTFYPVDQTPQQFSAELKPLEGNDLLRSTGGYELIITDLSLSRKLEPGDLFFGYDFFESN